MLNVLLKGLTKILPGAISGFFSDRAGRRTTELDVRKAALKAAKDSWLDELYGLVFLFPILFLMLGALETTFFGTTKMMDATKLAFIYMGSAPETYWYIIGGIVSAIFGLKVGAKGIAKGMGHYKNMSAENEAFVEEVKKKAPLRRKKKRTVRKPKLTK